jgi:hypothetical protein
MYAPPEFTILASDQKVRAPEDCPLLALRATVWWFVLLPTLAV